MRHYKKGRKLGTDKSHTKAMKRNLICSLFLNDRIKTIESRAKEIRGDVDKIIVWAKRGDLHSRRLAIAALGGDKYLVQEIFEKVSQGMFKERNSGFTRIVKLGVRKGDNAHMVIIELINEGKKKTAEKPAENKSAGKSESKPVENKEEKPAEKKEDKPVEKKEEKAEDKKEEKAEEKKEDKPAEKKEDKPEEKKEDKPAEKKEEKATEAKKEEKPVEKKDEKPAEEKKEDKPEEKKEETK